MGRDCLRGRWRGWRRRWSGFAALLPPESDAARDRQLGLLDAGGAAFDDLAAVHADRRRGDDAEADLVADDAEDGDADATVDHDLFFRAAGEYQHRDSFRFFRCAI